MSPDIGPAAEVGVILGYRLAFNDEFDGTALDESKWRVSEGRYLDGTLTRDSITVANGVVRFTTHTEGGVHHSGYITTAPVEYGYGYFEARVWLSGAPGQNCAFWTNPDTVDQYPGDPSRAGVELDIFEHRLVDQYGENLSDRVYLASHWYGAGGALTSSGKLVALPGLGKIQGTWRTFGVLWEPTGYTFYADDKPLWKPAAPPTGRPAPVKLACQVFDKDWAGNIPPGGFGSRETSTAGMAVDWVRIWQPPN